MEASEPKSGRVRLGSVELIWHREGAPGKGGSGYFLPGGNTAAIGPLTLQEPDLEAARYAGLRYREQRWRRALLGMGMVLALSLAACAGIAIWLLDGRASIRASERILERTVSPAEGGAALQSSLGGAAGTVEIPGPPRAPGRVSVSAEEWLRARSGSGQ